MKLTVAADGKAVWVRAEGGYLPAQMRCDLLSELLQQYDLFELRQEKCRPLDASKILALSERRVSSSLLKKTAEEYAPYAHLLPQKEYCLCRSLPSVITLSPAGRPAARAFAMVELVPEGRFDAIRIECKGQPDEGFVRYVAAAAERCAAMLPSAKERTKGKRNYHLAAVSSLAFFIASFILAIAALAVPAWVSQAFNLLVIAGALLAVSVLCFVLFSVLWCKVRRAEKAK